MRYGLVRKEDSCAFGDGAGGFCVQDADACVGMHGYAFASAPWWLELAPFVLARCRRG